MANFAWISALVFTFIITFIFFILSWTTDPGYLKKSERVSFLTLVERFDPNTLCPTCGIVCTNESRHCYICNRCVERFDHHCMWINNCVGTRNHSFFFIYVFSMLTHLITVISFCIASIDNVVDRDLTVENPIFAIFVRS